jgi:hypothetical protein
MPYRGNACNGDRRVDRVGRSGATRALLGTFGFAIGLCFFCCQLSSRHPPTQPPSRKLQQPFRRRRKRYIPIAALNTVGSGATIAIALVPAVGAAYFPEYLIAERKSGYA